MSAEPADPGGRAPTLHEQELRIEVDRLRLENQQRAMELEDARDPLRAAFWHGRNLWRAGWQQYYIARWKLLHARDPKRALRARHAPDPYPVRMLHPPRADRPRVVHFIGNFYTGGSARLVVDLIEHLGHRFDQNVVVRSLPPAPAYTGVDLIHLERLRRPGRVGALLRRLRPELVHVHMLGHQYDDYGRRDWSWYHHVFQAVERYGCPVIENLNIPVEPYVSGAVRCYVHVSHYMKAQFGRLDAWNETIHPGSDLDLFARTPDQPVPDDSIGMVYRLQPDKLDEQSIEPFIEVVRRRSATKVRIVGGGQFLEPYRQRVARAGVADAFTFTDYVPYMELPGQLAGMSLFVAPVHTESFGQVSPFAMGMALPVVGYRVGALEEITGAPELLAPAGDAAGLADIIIDLLDDRARRLRIGEHNRRRAQALFSVQAMARRYETLYDRVLATPHGRRPRAPITSTGMTPARTTATLRGAPVVTVLMAVHNGERHLREAIESTLTQTYANFELVIVDDGSTDGTRSIIDSYPDPRLRVIRNERNLGLARSLNRGIALARGRYIARLDADDVSEPDRLACQVAFMDRHHDLALLGSWYRIIDENGRPTGRRWVPCDHAGICWMLEFCSAFAHSAVMIRKSALDEIGLYDESLVYAMDYDLWCRIAARARVANLDEFLLRWRTSPVSMTARFGDRTERFDGVVARLAARLSWPAGAAADNERKADLLCGIVSGATPDASIEEAGWAVRTLFELHDDFCRRHDLDATTARALRSSLLRETSRSLFWMGHSYPDRRGYGYAWRTLLSAGHLHPPSLLTREAAALVVKLIGGRPAVATIRHLTHDRAR